MRALGGVVVGWLVAASACGRIGFDAQTSASDAPAVNGDTASGYPGPFDHLLIWYPMDGDPAAGAVDASGNHRDAACGTATCPTSVPGRHGQAFDLPAAAYLRLPNDAGLDGLTQLTIAFWASRRAFNGDGMSKAYGAASGDSFEVGVLVDGTPAVCTNAPSASQATCDQSTAGPIQMNRWYHFAVTDDQGALVLYVDGMPVATPLQQRPTAFDTHDVLIGAEEMPSNNSVDYFLDGQLDDVRVYDRALSPAEIAALAAP